jgi:hypothetical protein
MKFLNGTGVMMFLERTPEIDHQISSFLSSC